MGERAYLELLRDTLENGVAKCGTRALFHRSLTFPLADERGNILPLFTTKRVFYRGVVEELAWFLRGSTDTTELASRNVHIWDDNGSLEYLRSRNLPYREGLLGPVYGFQWRYFGAKYGPEGAPEGPYVDQIEQLLASLRDNPFSRAHLVTGWNPTQLAEMALPPCHVLYSWQVGLNNGRKTLSGALTMRSSDLFLGLPFNVASLAIFTHLLCKHTNMLPASITLHLEDAHIYDEHVDAVREQLRREPFEFPKFRVIGVPDLWRITPDDFELGQYKCHPKLSAPLVVKPTSNFTLTKKHDRQLLKM